MAVEKNGILHCLTNNFNSKALSLYKFFHFR